MKNIFYQRIDGEWLGALEHLTKQYKINSIYTIVGEEMYNNQPTHHEALLKGNSELREKIKQKFNIVDLYLTKLENYKYTIKPIPLDSDLLSSMAPYEKTILKMFERDDYKSFDFEQRMVNYHSQLSFWNTFIEKENIDAVFFVVYPHAVHNYILYALCKIKNIPVYFFALTSIPFYFLPTSDIEKLSPSFHEKHQSNLIKYSDFSIDDIKLNNDFNRIFIEHSRDRVPEPYYMNDSHFKKLKSINVKSFLKRLRKKPIESIINPIKRRVIHKNRIRTLTRIYNSFTGNIELNNKFIYFPLHYQPEGTTCPMGGHFVWQSLAIKMLSYYMPDDTLIYVKEHPSIFHFEVGRDVKLYHQLRKLENVVIVPLNIPSSDLVKNSVAVATITGTAAFEAIFKGKKSIIFGNHINVYAPNIFSVKNNEDCRKAISSIFESTNNSNTSLSKDIKIFLKTLEEYSVKIGKLKTEELDECIQNSIIKGYKNLLESKSN